METTVNRDYATALHVDHRASPCLKTKTNKPCPATLEGEAENCLNPGRRGCSELRSRHCTLAWVRVRLCFNKKKKKERKKKKKRFNWTYSSIWLGKPQYHGGRRKEPLTWQQQEKMRKMRKQKPLIKPSDLMRLIHYHENSIGETAPMIQIISHHVTPIIHGDSRSTIQDKSWVGTQSQTISFLHI